MSSWTEWTEKGNLGPARNGCNEIAAETAITGETERYDDYKRGRKDTSLYRDHVIAWSKDLGRSIDYLETRSDIDHNKLAYEGYSWGAAMGAVLPAVGRPLQSVGPD